jgi:hypothetical protein
VPVPKVPDHDADVIRIGGAGGDLGTGQRRGLLRGRLRRGPVHHVDADDICATLFSARSGAGPVSYGTGSVRALTGNLYRYTFARHDPVNNEEPRCDPAERARVLRLLTPLESIARRWPHGGSVTKGPRGEAPSPLGPCPTRDPSSSLRRSATVPLPPSVYSACTTPGACVGSGADTGPCRGRVVWEGW